LGGNEKPTGNFDKKLAINQFGKIQVNEIQKALGAHTKNSWGVDLIIKSSKVERKRPTGNYRKLKKN